MLFELNPRLSCAVKLVTGVKLGLHGSGLLVYLIKQPGCCVLGICFTLWRLGWFRIFVHLVNARNIFCILLCSNCTSLQEFALLLNSFIALIRIAQILLVNAICFLLRFNSLLFGFLSLRLSFGYIP